MSEYVPSPVRRNWKFYLLNSVSNAEGIFGTHPSEMVQANALAIQAMLMLSQVLRETRKACELTGSIWQLVDDGPHGPVTDESTGKEST